jgi:hypothetical protein
MRWFSVAKEVRISGELNEAIDIAKLTLIRRLR